MPSSNEFLTYATGGGANVSNQADWAALLTRPTGFAAGVARSAEFNKAWRQAGFPGVALTQLVADQLAVAVLDNGIVADLQAQILAAIQSIARAALTPTTYTAAWSVGPFTVPVASRGVLSLPYVDGVKLPATKFTFVGTTFTPIGVIDGGAGLPFGTTLELIYV